jgi:TatA/E family protein of Tat protein translocase
MGLGMPEVVLILVVALIIFGPRKLPELGKSLGQAMSQFRRASDDFKRTWEQEVETEKYRATSSSSSSTYHAADPEDPYNPYASDSDASKQLESGHETATVEPKKSEPETVAAASSPKKHWI